MIKKTAIDGFEVENYMQADQGEVLIDKTDQASAVK